MHLPILNIKQFQNSSEDHFYTNIFSKHLIENHHAITTPHKHDFYLSVLFTQGSGTHEIDFNSYPIEKGALFFLKPGQTHNWWLSEDIEGYIFFHSKSYYDLHYSRKSVVDFPFFYSSQNSPYLLLQSDQMTKIEPLFQSILDEFRNEDLMQHQKIKSLIDLLYIDIARWCVGNRLQDVSKSNSYVLKIYQLENLIEQHYLTHKLASTYAEWMHMTPKHLNRITKTTLGKTTSELIIERVLLEAKRMLVHSENQLTDIADHLGFIDYAYFSRVFKSKTGENPSDFQRRYHQG